MDEVMVARIGRANGLKGEVTVQLHTDRPQERFTPGARFRTDPPIGEITVRSARMQGTTWVLGFEQVHDRTAAEGLRDTRLMAAPDEDDDDGWYEDDLIDLQVYGVDGALVGVVVALLQRPAQDLLEVALEGGGTAYVPFVEQIVPVVDIEAGRIEIDPPAGLLDLGRS